MTFLAALLLMAAVIAFVGYPLIRSRPETEVAEDEELGELSSRREATYSAIKELEFDYELGNLSQRDYQDLEQRYKDRAVSILKEIDSQERGRGIEEEIEEEVLKLRRSRKRAGGLVCPQCGAPHEAGGRFCSQCGARLAPKGGGID